jgi:hypothetical protein
MCLQTQHQVELEQTKKNLLLQSMKDNATQKNGMCMENFCTIQMNEKVANPNLQLSWLGAKP